MDQNQDIDRLKLKLPVNIVQEISQEEIGDRDKRDICIWTPTNSGEFNCKSAWNILRQKRNDAPF